MRLLASLAALALSLAATPALAQGRPQMRGAALIGFEDGDADAGLSLRFDGELVQRPLAPGMGFSIVGSLGYSRFSEDGGYYDYYAGVESAWEATASVFKVVPAARFTFGRSPTVRPYVDAGLGLYYATMTYEETWVMEIPTYPYFMAGSDSFDDSEVGLMLRLAAGLTFDVSPGFALGAELGFSPYLGDNVDDTMVSLLLAAQFRL